MRPEDDDDAESGGGPPPDPSMRQWRHPSEIAAASAAAARPEESSPMRRRGPLVMALAVTATASIAVGFGALVFAVVLDATGSDGGFSLGPDGSTPLARSATSLLNSSLIETAPSVDPTSEASGDQATSARSTPTTIPDRTVWSEPPPISISGPTTTSLHQVAAESRAWPAGSNGLFTDTTEAATRLATFLVVDDTIFTSASAIDGHDEVAMLADGEWASATVVARDLVNDLAILDVADPAAKASILTEHGAVWSSEEAPAQAAEGARIVLDVDGENPVEGFIIDADQRVVATTGSSVYGALLTSAPRPEGASGAALTDEAGALIGLVVDTAGTVAAVVPIETVVAVGRSVRQWGVPAIEWLGIKGSTLPSGGVRLDEVTAGGPAQLAELLPGDVITRINGVSVLDWDHLVHLIRRSGAGSTVNVAVERDSAYRLLRATVGAKNEHPAALKTEAEVAGLAAE